MSKMNFAIIFAHTLLLCLRVNSAEPTAQAAHEYGVFLEKEDTFSLNQRISILEDLCSRHERAACAYLAYYEIRLMADLKSGLNHLQEATRLGSNRAIQFVEKYDLFALTQTESKEEVLHDIDLNEVRLCYLGFGQACSLVALKLESQKQFTFAKYYLEIGCGFNSSIACKKLAGYALYSQDFAHAVNFYQKACASGLGAECEHYIFMTAALGKEVDAQTELERLCTEGIASACTAIASDPLPSSFSGNDIDRLRRGCKLGDKEACSIFFFSDERRQEPWVKGVLENLCIQGDTESCFWKKYDLYKGNFPETELQSLDELCKKNSISACTHLGIEYTLRIKDYQKAVGYFEKACSVYDASSCYYAGRLYQRQSEPKLAQELFRKGCDFSSAKSCKALE